MKMTTMMTTVITPTLMMTMIHSGGDGSALSPAEQAVDQMLMQEKRAIIEAARLNGSTFNAMYSFLNQTSKAAMEATKAFQIIKNMPKGGGLLPLSLSDLEAVCSAVE
jgi:hypothetical protein